MLKISEIGNKIKAIREEKKLTQNEVIEKLAGRNVNISRETLSKIENGSRSISAVELNALCNIFNIDINVFLNENETDDLVTFYRKKNFDKNTVEEIEQLQDMLKIFIYQKKIFNGEFELQKRKPLWEEC